MSVPVGLRAVPIRCSGLSIEISDRSHRKNPFVDSFESSHIGSRLDSSSSQVPSHLGDNRRTRNMKAKTAKPAAKKPAAKAPAKKAPAKKKK
jgi:hypothetical protein